MTKHSTLNFEKNGTVSVWYSVTPYTDIPDSYFEEDEKGICEWARNFKIEDYVHDNIETNGIDQGTVTVEKAVGECSYSCSYCDAVVKKINSLGDNDITWIILLFDFEYLPKKTKSNKDTFVTYVGAFPYDMQHESVFDVE